MEQIVGPLLSRAADQLGGPAPLRRVLRGVLSRAARRAFGVDVDVRVDVAEGMLSLVLFRRVVERPGGPDEIGLAQARAIDDAIELGDELGCTMALDALAPYLEGALVVPVEQYAPLRALLRDLMWDREVLAPVPVSADRPRVAINRLVELLHRTAFGPWLRPGCDAYELEAHAMILGRPLPRGLRGLLAGIGGMQDDPDGPRLTLCGQGYRLLSPLEAQREHTEWTRRREEISEGTEALYPASVWDSDWLPVAVGSRGAEATTLLVIDPLGSSAARPQQLLVVSFEEVGWWTLGLDVEGLAHVWHTLAVHDLLEYVDPSASDPIEAAKVDAMTTRLVPEYSWVDGHRSVP